MEKLTERQVIMITEKQAESLAILKRYDVNVSQFQNICKIFTANIC